MKKEFKGFVLGVVASSIAIGGMAYAKTGSETIEAAYNNIKIYIDGVLLNPKDGNGNTVEPFIADGTTYLPVRAVGEAVGKQVTWDGATSSVYLGEVPGQVTYLTDVLDAFSSNYYEKYTTENGKSFNMGGSSYTNGFVIGGYNGSNGEAIFNLNGNYKTITFEMGHVDNSNSRQKASSLQIYIDDKLVEEYEIEYDDLPQKVTLPLNNGLKLQIKRINCNGIYVADVGFGNVTLQ